jgi:hypothetical protein
LAAVCSEIIRHVEEQVAIYGKTYNEISALLAAEVETRR